MILRDISMDENHRIVLRVLRRERKARSARE